MQSHWKYKDMKFSSLLISLNVVLGCGLDNLCKSMFYLLPSYLTEISSETQLVITSEIIAETLCS